MPHLNLPSGAASASHLQQHLLEAPTAVHSSDSSPALTPAARAQAPNLLDSAVPLVTTRPPATSTRAGAQATDTHLLVGGRHQQQGSLLGAEALAAAGHASAQSTAYHIHRQACAVYVDKELQALCLELALHLLGTPAGLLDPLQLPQEPAGVTLKDNSLCAIRAASVCCSQIRQPVAHCVCAQAGSSMTITHKHPLLFAHALAFQHAKRQVCTPNNKMSLLTVCCLLSCRWVTAAQGAGVD